MQSTVKDLTRTLLSPRVDKRTAYQLLHSPGSSTQGTSGSEEKISFSLSAMECRAKIIDTSRQGFKLPYLLKYVLRMDIVIYGPKLSNPTPAMQMFVEGLES